MSFNIIQSVEDVGAEITINVALPDRSLGVSKAQLYERFAHELGNLIHLRNLPLGKVVRLNGPATTEMALTLGVWAARYGAAGVELFDPQAGAYVPVLGRGSMITMPLPVEPGMRVEITGGSLLARGAQAVVINVGAESVNVGEIGGRGRRETAWTDRRNVRPVGWEKLPDWF